MNKPVIPGTENRTKKQKGMKTTNANTKKQFRLLNGDIAKFTTVISHITAPRTHASNCQNNRIPVAAAIVSTVPGYEYTTPTRSMWLRYGGYGEFLYKVADSARGCGNDRAYTNRTYLCYLCYYWSHAHCYWSRWARGFWRLKMDN